MTGRRISGDGKRYGGPGMAVEWGEPGCPLLARGIRESMAGREMPPEVSALFGRTMTADQMDGQCLERHGIPTLKGEARAAVKRFLQKVEQLEWTVIPAGAPRGWVERLPLAARTRNAIQARNLLRIRNIGMMGANETACVIESAEAGESAEKSAPHPYHYNDGL